MDLAPGLEFGNGYRIVEQIGRGGMGAVYKAFQPALDRYVAVKVLSAPLADQEGFRERFQQEAVAVAKLRHPNILVVFDYGELDDAAYLVSEFIDGRPLSAFVGSPLTLDFAERALAPIASALDYAHAQNILHRDIKPSNILLARDGRPVLADFGLVKLLDGAVSQAIFTTSPGLLVGTPAYMAPEYAAGDPIGAAADRYALAVVAYEVLVGKTPYTADTPLAVLLAHANKPLPSPRSINPDIPVAVEEVLLIGLSKEPTARYPTAATFIAALIEGGRTTAGKAAAAAVVPATGGDTAPPTPIIGLQAPKQGDANARTGNSQTGMKAGAARRPRNKQSGQRGSGMGVLGPVLEAITGAYTRVLWLLTKGIASLRSRLPLPLLLGGVAAVLLALVGIVVVLSHGGSQPAAVATATAAPSTPSNAVASATSIPEVAAASPSVAPSATSASIVVPGQTGPGVWTLGAVMKTSRSSFQAVRLADGRVLAAGGFGTNGPMADAEIYDPKANSWKATCSMIAPRYNLTLTLLPNGKVLAAGGATIETDLDTAELYDPKTGSWSATGSMHTPRDQHTATVLRNGMVLVTGGETTGAVPINAAELFNPTTGTWSATGALTTPRWDHTATLLQSGKVLVAGGGGKTAELYDPATGHWSLTGPMSTVRYRHTATLLPNGKVLVAGGELSFTSLLNTAEIYDPASGQWSAAGTMSTTHSRHTATLLATGLVLIADGSTGKDTQTTTETGTAVAELYHPATNSWTTAGHLHGNHAEDIAIPLQDNQVLVAGGYADQGSVTGSTELYNPLGK